MIRPSLVDYQSLQKEKYITAASYMYLHMRRNLEAYERF